MILKGIGRTNKKGDIQSIIIMIIILFVIALVCLFFSRVFLEFLGQFKNIEQIHSNENALNTVELVESHTIPWLDYLFFFTFIGISLGIIISSAYVDTSPVFLVIFIIVMIILIVLAGIFANVFYEVGTSSELSSTYDQFILTKAIMSNLPVALLVIIIITIFVLYGKGKSIAGGGI